MSRRIVEYSFLYSTTASDQSEKRKDLINQVNKYISMGWEPIGGVVLDENSEGKVYLQAVVRLAGDSKS